MLSTHAKSMGLAAVRLGDLLDSVVLSIALRRMKANMRQPDPTKAIEILISGVQPSESWREKVACKGVPPEWFFSESEEDAHTRVAFRCCARCPVQDDCYAFAITNGELNGVWGGVYMTPRRFYTRRRELRMMIGDMGNVESEAV